MKGMKEYFREYYGLTPQQLKGFFDSCLFVFDTNALLDLYRLDISDAKEVISVIKHYEDRVIIPYHVAEEYHTELLNVISKSIQNSDETLKYDYDTAITNFLTNISKFRDLPFALQEKYNRKLEDVIAELKTDVAGRKENLKKCMEGWDLQCQVADLLGKLLQHPLSLDRINEIVTVDGPKRYAASIPPGYKDMKKTNGNEYGDLIIWQEILDCAKDKKKSIAFISRDLKEDWIEKRIKSIQDRKKLTDIWKENGIEKNNEYAILTNEIYEAWSGMNQKQYKKYKGLKKESLRDNMDNIELILTYLGEEATRRLAMKYKPNGLKENMITAREGGMVAKTAKDSLEAKLNEKIVTNNNKIGVILFEEGKK